MDWWADGLMYIILIILDFTRGLIYKSWADYETFSSLFSSKFIIYSQLLLTSSFSKIFIQLDLDELDKFDKITQAWIGFNKSLTQAQKTL